MLENDVWITIIALILGILANIVVLKLTFQNELRKEKNRIHFEKLADIPLDVFGIISSVMNSSPKTNELPEDFQKKFQNMLSKVYAYGTEDAIKIVSSMQAEQYSKNNPKSDNLRPICFYIILVTQIRFDLTGIKVNPELWYKMRLTDYGEKKKDFAEKNNEIAHELKLCDFLYVK